MAHSGTTFFVYENWRARGHIARIHRSECGLCQHGSGIHGVYNRRNGQWLGPFDTMADARRAAAQTRAEVRACKFCCPEGE